MKSNTRTLVTLILLTLGLTIAGVWTNVVGYSVNLLPVNASFFSNELTSDAFLFGRLFAGIMLIVFARHIPKIQTSLIVVIALSMSVTTGTLIISYHQSLLNPTILATASVFIAGCGYLFIVSIFYIFFARCVQTEQAVICITVSLVLETILSILVSLYLPPLSQFAIVFLAPMTVAACYLLAEHSGHQLGMQVPPSEKVYGYGKYVLVGSVVAFTIVLALVRALSNVGVWGKIRANFTGMIELSVGELIAISIILLLMSYLVFVLPHRKLSLFSRSVIGFAAMLAGLQLLALANDLQFSHSFDTVTTATELFSHLVRWMMVIECIRRTDIPPFRVAGITGPAYAIVSLIWISSFENFYFATSTLVMTIIYLLFLVVLFFSIQNRFSKSDTGSDNLIQDDIRAYRIFQNEYGLSARESQIFELLMQDMKRSDIERECSLSQGTVKTHISNIYRKLDVHSKREMKELFATKNLPDREFKQNLGQT